jgi:hypothetical protein
MGRRACIGPRFRSPTFFYSTDDDSKRTYDYAPIWYCPTVKLQVHCHNGIVTAIEELDD